MWKNTLKELIQSGESVILLHGNTRDVFPSGNEFVSLREYLFREAASDRDYKVYYDLQGGIQFSDVKQREEYFRTLQGYDAYHKTNYAESPPRDPGPAFSVLENMARLKLLDKKSFVCVIHYLEHITPAGLNTSNELRYLLIAIDKWAQNLQFMQNKITFFLIAENLARIDTMITRNQFIPRLLVPRPDETSRIKFFTGNKSDIQIADGLADTTIGQLTSGLSLVHMAQMLHRQQKSSSPLTLETIKIQKKQFIEGECSGLLTFVEPRFDLSYVAGHEKVKEILRSAARAVKEGLTKYLPMGYLVCGPIGTGKTFLVDCFAGEIGIPVVKFQNFRSQWQGETEANLEKILNLLRSANPVAVMIDEADAFLGNRDAQGDSGVSMRVFASLAAFMSDTQYRGKVIWFLMTSRPDLLPVDMKRQGRAEEHIALFHPQSSEELEAVFQALARKNGIDATNLRISDQLQKGRTFSGADIEAILVRAALTAQLAGEKRLTADTIVKTASDFLSPNYPLEIELQTLLAIRECTHKDMIPEKYHDKDGTEILMRVNELLALLRQN